MAIASSAAAAAATHAPVRPRHVVVATLVVATVAAIALLLLTTACGPQKYKSLGVDPAHVTSVEMEFYQYIPKGMESPPQQYRRATVSDPAVIKELVHGFADMPVGGVGNAWKRAVGAEAASLQFILDDGSTATLREIFIAAGDVIIVWDDGTESHAKRGVPLVDLYGYGDRG